MEYIDKVSKISVSGIFGMIGGVIALAFGGFDINIISLIILMSVDFVTGLLIAIFKGNSRNSENGGLSSSACWNGIIKKMYTLLIVVVAVQMDRLLGSDFIRNSVIIAFCTSEIISICENAALMGILPEGVNKVFKRVIDLMKGEDNNEKDKLGSR